MIDPTFRNINRLQLFKAGEMILQEIFSLSINAISRNERF